MAIAMASLSLSSSSSYSPTSKSFSFRSSIKNPNISISLPKPTPAHVPGPAPVNASNRSFDVVVIGAGIIGLTIARQFLTGSDLSVAVVDKAVPCSGATGAGQGYIWMTHKTPGTDTWDLAMRSHELWETLAATIHARGVDPLHVLGWKKTGSLLVGRTGEESMTLQRRVKQLSEAGVKADYLSSSDLSLQEPSLYVENESGAAFLPDDSQLDAQRTVAFIEQGNQQYASQGRYAEFYHDPVMSLVRRSMGREVVAVQTSKTTLYCKVVIVAAGCWSGSLMHDLLKESGIILNVPVKPRKGHLLVIENFRSIQLNHGLMEFGYVNHQNLFLKPGFSASEPDDEQALAISMTATMDAMGNLVLGSSRQFVGFNTEVDESVIDRIWKRAVEFFPKLREMNLTQLRKGTEVRVGLRPYMPDGKPVIGPVPGMPNVFLAAGHEGSGLSLALGTAEMVANMVLDNSGEVDPGPYAVGCRCC